MINGKWVPSETYSSLTPDRLTIVGDVIRKARDSAAEDHRPKSGETRWSLGVRAFERTCAALTWAVQQYNWLSVPHGTGGGPVHFIFRIGIHPIRFYHGSPDEMPSRYRQPSHLEEEELQAAFEFDRRLPKDVFLRVSVETDRAQKASEIKLIECDAGGEPQKSFTIPRVSVSATVKPFAPVQKEGVELPAPSTEIIDIEQKKKDAE